MKKQLGAKTIVCPSPVWCIGTYDKNEKPNIMTASWAGICCSKPPAVAVSLRKATYSYQNIVDSKAFTVNVPSRRYAREVDYLGIASGRNTDKFKDAGLTAVKAEYVRAPYVKEFPLVLECLLLHTLEIGMHTQFVGEILDVKADETVMGSDGTVDIKDVDPLIFSATSRKYYGVGEFAGNAFKVGKDLVEKE